MRTGVAGVTDQAVVSLTNFVTLVRDHGLRTLGRPQDTFVASVCGLPATLVSALALVPLAGAVGGAYGLAAGSVVASAVRLAAFHQAAGRATVRTRVVALERI